MAKVLIVDDEGKMRALIAMALDCEGYGVEEAGSGEEAIDKMDVYQPDVVITDVRMPKMTGIDLVRKIRTGYPNTECIVMTAFADAKSGIEAMRAGAVEYVSKPFEMDEMLLLVKGAVEKNVLNKEIKVLKKDFFERYSLESITGKSAKMQELIKHALAVAARPTTVLIRGSSGTGKELVARGIHAASKRSIFVAVNCGAIPDNLLESELFGYEKGAFTGANARKTGLFEQAGDGTIFLDEIGDLPLRLQVKILRVLQEKEFTRVGGTLPVHTDARVIAATNRNLEDAVKAGEFREDLYYRLSVFPVFVPSLAERTEDIPALVDVFCLRYHHTGGVSGDAMKCLMEYSWPGNVRELENCVERSAIMSGNSEILPSHLPPHIRERKIIDSPHIFNLPETGISLDEVEKNLVLQALEKSGGNKSQAARLLGISRRAMYSKMKTHRITGYGDDENNEDAV